MRIEQPSETKFRFFGTGPDDRLSLRTQEVENILAVATHITFAYCAVSPRVLERMIKLGKIVRLWMVHTTISDDMLEAIAEMKSLREFYLGNPRNQNFRPRLQVLTTLTGLERLRLEGMPQIDDAALPILAQLSELQVVALVDTSVSGTGLSQLVKLRKLWSLWLNGTPVTATSLDGLRLASLRVLSLATCMGLTAAHINSIKWHQQMPRLKEIWVSPGLMSALELEFFGGQHRGIEIRWPADLEDFET